LPADHARRHAAVRRIAVHQPAQDAAGPVDAIAGLTMNPTVADGLLEQAVSSGAFPGVVAMVGDRDGVLYEGVFGRLSVDGEAPVAADTFSGIAPMTKAMAGVAALGMIERGELEPSQPVADVIPAFADLPVLEGFDGDEPRLRPARRQATIRHL